MITRIYLAVIGLLYLGLAAWCSVAPQQTAEKVGFTLNGDSGKSEFITVYGGLELGLAAIFLLPLFDPATTRFGLLSCLMIHGSLVIFRSASLLMHRDFGAMTGKLAVGEWVILLSGLVVWFMTRRPSEA